MNEYDYDLYEEESDEPIRYYHVDDFIGIDIVDETPPKKQQPNFEEAIKGGLDYPLLIQMYAEYRDIVSFNNKFYTPDGIVTDDTVKQHFYRILEKYGYSKDMVKPVKNLTEGLKIAVHKPDFSIAPNIIPLKDGDLEYIGGCQFVFHRGAKRYTPYRLPITVDTNLLTFYELDGAKSRDGIFKPVSFPATFGKWMRDLFMQEDYETIQEMFGYCLVPSTKVQEMFMIVGEGGVGKGGIKVILETMLGDALTGIDLNLLLKDKFRLAQIENKLVGLEEELQTESLDKTDLFKKLITNEGKMAMERKFVNEYQGNAFAKIICLTNSDMTTIGENNNEGFFRRIHPINTKVLDRNRVNDPALYEKIKRHDLNWIFLWSLLGLAKLVDGKNWHIYWSDRSKDYIAQMRKTAVNMDDFIEDCCLIGDGDMSVNEVYMAYTNWCNINGVAKKSRDTFSKWMARNHEKLGFECTRVTRDSTRIRGYKGIKLK